MLVPTKKWYQSKTFWLGVLEIIIGISELLMEFIGSTETGITSIIIGIATIILRYVTKQPITFTGKTQKQVSAIILLSIVPFLGACDPAGDRPQNGTVTDTTHSYPSGGGSEADRDEKIDDSSRND